jgi:NAD+ kinase
MRFGIIANRKRSGATKVIRRLLAWTKQNGHDYRVCEELSDFVDSPEAITKREDLTKYCDYIISMGGDGTLLAAARAIGASGIPVLGINLGSLGFLTQVAAEDMEQSLQALVDGKHHLEPRMLLAVTVDNRGDTEWGFALNDVVVDRGNVTRLIQLDLSVNEEFICTYRADGLIISTPTGSTAYNAAVGGPILNPRMNAIIASPIAPQSLAARSLLFDGDDMIKIKITSGHHSALMTIDGQVSIPLKNGQEVEIKRATHTTNLITFPDNSFYTILRNKLHWAVLPRTQNE